ncbi:LysR family transcriptional regulator [Sciscionella sediminilitoris]|uniref:LysR family transcriptional regulator n=1 Tax=Sciscionella sediminilitoris TaxID=1445613 RepID=UPI0004DFA5F5|nr:LysR family transcriptional regulator [Sciscionella sp. SE31]
MLDVRRLRVLSSVLTSGSISAAAVNLGYTPSAVSQQIAALTREAGAELLEKDGRGVRPTAAGTLLAGYAEEIMAKLVEAERALIDLREGHSGPLRMTYFTTAGATLVPPAVAEFRRNISDVRVDLKLNEPAYVVRGAADDPADIEIVVLHEDFASAQPGFTPVHLLDDPYRAVLPKDHPLADRDILDLAALAEEPWVDTEAPHGLCRQIMMKACTAAGFTPNFVVEGDDFPTAQGFVAAGLGVTLVPEIALGAVHNGIVVRHVRRPAPVRSIYAVVRDAVADRPAVQEMLRALQKVAGEADAGIGN